LTEARPTTVPVGDDSNAGTANADRPSTHARAPIRSRLPHRAVQVRQLGLRARLTVALAIILTAAMS
jgi:hypothetical protein